ncbi:hypothetical protein ACYRFT_02540 [Listeria kieliensis]
MTMKNLTILVVAILTVLAVFYFVSQTIVQHIYGETAEQAFFIVNVTRAIWL